MIIHVRSALLSLLLMISSQISLQISPLLFAQTQNSKTQSPKTKSSSTPSKTQQELYSVEKHSTHLDKTLNLYDLLQKITQTHPILIASQAQIKSAQADYLSAQGAYDLEWTAQTKTTPLSPKSEWGYQDTQLSQLTQLGGLSFFGGYSKTLGGVPVYAQDLKTKDLGELNMGLNLPILQGRKIDEFRAKLAQNEIKIDLANTDMNATLLKLYLSTAKSYWKWITSAHKMYIDQRLLDMALERALQIEQRVKEGDAAPIEGIENAQAVLKRKGNLIKSQQALRYAAYDLSLYLRDDTGKMILPSEDIVPVFIPDANLKLNTTLLEDQQYAVQTKPSIIKQELYLKILEIDLDLADNQLLPKLDLSVQAYQGMDSQKAVSESTEMQAALKFKLPIQRRKAQGASAKARAELDRLKADLQFQKDLLYTEVADARISLETSIQRIILAEQELDFAMQVEEAERTKLKLGDSSLFVLNLREQSTADAGIRLIEALADFHLSYAMYLTSTSKGLDLKKWEKY
jgi:outer membrane protein TolC